MEGRWRYFFRQALVALLLVESFAAWSLLRSDLFLDEPVRRLLGNAGEQLGGHFSYSSIRPAGLTGIVISDLCFHEPGAGVTSVEIESLHLYPDLGSLLLARPRIARLELTSVQVTAEYHPNSLPLLGQVASADSLQRSLGTDRQRTQQVRRIWSRLPERVVVDGLVLDLSVPEFTESALRVTSEHSILRLDPSVGHPNLEFAGDFEVAGSVRASIEASWHAQSGLQLDLQFDRSVDVMASLPDSLERWLPESMRSLSHGSVYLGGLSLVYPGTLVTFHDLELKALNTAIPGIERWRLDGFSAERLEFRPEGSSPRVSFEHASVVIAGILSDFEVPLLSGQVGFDWADLSGHLQLRLGETLGNSLELTASLDGNGNIRASIEADEYPLNMWRSLLPEDGSFVFREGLLTVRAELGTALETGGLADIWANIDGHVSSASATVLPLSSRTLEAIELGLSAQVAYSAQSGQVRLSWGVLSIGQEELSFEGSYAASAEGPVVLGRLEARDVEAGRFFRGLPRGLAPTLEDMEFSGSFTGSLVIGVDFARPELARVDLQLDMGGVTARYPTEIPIEQLSHDFALTVSTSDGSSRRIGPLTGTWVGLEEVAPQLVQALISAEDGSFFRHEGFDWSAIVNSLRENLAEGRFARGGSTISQQVARSLFLGQEKTLGRKFEEAVLTWQLERNLSKERIMELYVNVVHFGPGIYGIREAALNYFNRVPADLSLRESAFLASILPDPDYFGAEYGRQIVPHSRREKICRVLRNMRQSGEIGTDEFESNCQAAREARISVVPPPDHLVEGRRERVDEGRQSLFGLLAEGRPNQHIFGTNPTLARMER